jgi:hypothetical protein
MEFLMDKCTKERIYIASLRTGITAVTGAALWFFAGWLAQRYGYNLATEMQAGIGLLGMIGSWFATKPMFSFTQECLAIQEATAPRPKKAAATKVYLPTAKAATATAKIKADKKPEPTPTDPLSVGKLIEQGRITVEVTKPEDSNNLQVTVTARGLSASEFKGNNGNSGFRQKLENISGVSWENPKNLGDGRRTITGTVKSSNTAEVAAKLKEVATRYSA